MSRTPVRQALPLLAQEGLLIEHETRGFVVRAFTPADITDAIDLRGLLEGFAVRRAAASGGVSKSALRELRHCLEDGDAVLRKRSLEEVDEGRYAEMNSRFHSLIPAGRPEPCAHRGHTEERPNPVRRRAGPGV